MIIIGDVHGCYKTLMALLEKLPKEEKICFVGDLIDRGKDSKKVLDYVLDNHIDCVMGNHEEMMSQDRDLWFCNGGRKTLDNFNNNFDNVKEYNERIKINFPYYKEYDSFDKNNRKLVVVHGGFSNPDFQRCVKYGLVTWLRDSWCNVPNYFQIVGHTPVKEPIIEDYMAMIDTGCVFNKEVYNKLTALQFPKMKIYQQLNIEE